MNSYFKMCLVRDLEAIKTQQDKPTVPQVLPLVQRYYAVRGNETGGSLHIVLDDANVDTSSVEFCIDYAEKKNDQIGKLLAQVLLRMSKTQRLKLYKAPKEVVW